VTLTSDLCTQVAELACRPLPPSVAAHAARTLFNVIGTAIGASHSDEVDILLRHAAAHGGLATAPVLGRAERVDPLNAAVIAGAAAHYDDFDDTHLETVIHPGAATMGALLGASAGRAVAGADALTAFALGVETQLRIGLAISPTHYDDGWHITGTCGPIGAAVTTGLVLGLDVEGLRNAVGIAASQSLGLREAFGTHTKPFHPGKAAANGLLAGLLAAEGMTAPEDALEADRGFAAVLGRESPQKLIDLIGGLGDTWELERNAFKPYPCGIVSHPCIDAAVALHHRIGGGRIASVVLRCHPLVPELTGNPDPEDGLQARFSTVHGVAAGLADGVVGLAQYADTRVRAGDLVALRACTRLVADESIDRDAATVEVEMEDGVSFTEHVEHARGSLDRPFTDAELDAKVAALVEPVLPGHWKSIRTAVDGLHSDRPLTELIECCLPEGARS
jgi:2-methylcitrate dehydratase PrpD